MLRWVGVVLSALAMALAAGCGKAQGIDGDLVDDWPALAEAKVPVPLAGTCFMSPGTEVNDSFVNFPWTVTPCTTLHNVETYHVSTVAGTAAQAGGPPAGAGLREATAECHSTAQAFLGEDWRNGRLELLVVPPTPRQWRGGGRFFSCALVEVHSEAGRSVSRASTLKDGLRGARPLALSCVVLVNDSAGEWDDNKSVPCEQPHGGEFAGIVEVSERPYPTDDKLWEAAFGLGCESVVAKFLGMTDAQFEAHRQIGSAYWSFDKIGWERGNRSARCYATLFDNVTVSKSLKGMGNTKI